MEALKSLLGKRLKVSQKNKMDELAKQANAGGLSSFSGIFRVSEPSAQEEQLLEGILRTYRPEDKDIELDLKNLLAISSEVKAINNQAIMLHGERIKTAQNILKSYKEGAFTAWLIATYGNRQTPYNFLQYFEFYTSLPKTLQERVDDMPKQVIYSLSTRKIDLEEKKQFIMNSKGESKSELLTQIRETFPLSASDKRAPNLVQNALSTLQRLAKAIDKEPFDPSLEEKARLQELLKTIAAHVDVSV